MSLTRVTDVVTNPFEEFDRFHNLPPLRIAIPDVEYTRENLEEDQGNGQRGPLWDGDFANSKIG